jgi:hypothetical protein
MATSVNNNLLCIINFQSLEVNGIMHTHTLQHARAKYNCISEKNNTCPSPNERFGRYFFCVCRKFRGRPRSCRVCTRKHRVCTHKQGGLPPCLSAQQRRCHPARPCHPALDAGSPEQRRAFNQEIAGQAHSRQVKGFRI